MPRSPSTASSSEPLIDLPADAGPVLVAHARAAIAEGLGVPADRTPEPVWLGRFGATFVTLHLAGALRGCIGSLTAGRPLREDVRANARAAAFADPRFVPLGPDELDLVRIEVSVLSAPEVVASADRRALAASLRPGVDGLVLTCCGRRATLLPQVWDQVRDADEFLDHLVAKAGLPAGWWGPEVMIERYTVSRFAEEAP